MVVNFIMSILILTPINLMTIAQEKSLPREDDISAIKTVIQQQIDAYKNRDIEGEMTLWVQSEDVLKITDQGKCIRGWKNLRSRYATLFADPDFVQIRDWTTTTDNFNIVFHGNLTWVVHNQQDVQQRGWRRNTTLTLQTRILEKINGQWKILFHQTVEQSNID